MIVRPSYLPLQTIQLMIILPILAKLAVGGEADSAHEYLLKQFLLTRKTDKTALEMCKVIDTP